MLYANISEKISKQENERKLQQTTEIMIVPLTRPSKKYIYHELINLLANYGKTLKAFHSMQLHCNFVVRGINEV